MSAWWTEDRVNAVVNRAYIVGKLASKSQAALHRPLAFGHGLTDDTYLDWILSRGRRLFLIFDDIGIPEWIFEAVDRSFDDDDLPLSEGAIWDLDLSHGKTDTFDKRFYRRQWIYQVQDLRERSHVDYGADELVPVEPVVKRTGILSNPNIDRVYIRSRLYARRRVPIGGNNGVDRVHFVLHLKSLQRLSHPHLISIYATYIQNAYGYILTTPILDTSLKSFLEEPPKHFKALSKPERRKLLIQWIHCLTSALAYLHSRGHAHQAIRPSNIFISSDNHIYLGESTALNALEQKPPGYDREGYDYGAPEQWLRKPTLQETAPLRSTLHGGGRTVRRLPKDTGPQTLSSSSSTPRTSMTSIRTKTTNTATTSPMTHLFHRPTSSAGANAWIPPTIQPRTTGSSSSSTKSLPGQKRTLITTFLPSSTSRSSSLPHTLLFPSDIFSLSCLHLDILTSLISISSTSSQKFSPKSFSHYRSKKNRSAGRGGAPADSSFHANLGMVGRWIEKMDQEGSFGGDNKREKKQKQGKRGDDGRKNTKGLQEEQQQQPLSQLSALLKVVKVGLRREAHERWAAEEGKEVIAELVERWIGRVECCSLVEFPDTDSRDSESGTEFLTHGNITGGGDDEENEEEEDEEAEEEERQASLKELHSSRGGSKPGPGSDSGCGSQSQSQSPAGCGIGIGSGNGNSNGKNTPGDENWPLRNESLILQTFLTE